jgi:hypothetical protein
MNAAEKKAYRFKYAGFGEPSVGSLPGIVSPPDMHERFLWNHIRMAKSEGRLLPGKPRTKSLRPEEVAELRRHLENTAHHARFALAHLEKMK